MSEKGPGKSSPAMGTMGEEEEEEEYYMVEEEYDIDRVYVQKVEMLKGSLRKKAQNFNRGHFGLYCWYQGSLCVCRCQC